MKLSPVTSAPSRSPQFGIKATLHGNGADLLKSLRAMTSFNREVGLLSVPCPCGSCDGDTFEMYTDLGTPDLSQAKEARKFNIASTRTNLSPLIIVRQYPRPETIPSDPTVN